MRLDVKVNPIAFYLYRGQMKANVRFELQRQLFARSERVKGIDFHPTEPWVSPS